MTINWRLKTNLGEVGGGLGNLEMDSGSCPSRKFLPVQWDGQNEGVDPRPPGRLCFSHLEWGREGMLWEI